MVETTEEHNTQPAETAAFESAYEVVETARKQTDTLAADIGRHLHSLRAGDDVRRTGETQAALSTADIETIIDTLLEVRDALLAVLIGTGESRKGAVVPNEDAHEKSR